MQCLHTLLHRNNEKCSNASVVGIFLKDVTNDFQGNLVVYPGSHRILEKFFKENPSVLREVENRGSPALPKQEQCLLPPAKQVCGTKGDVIVAHYMLAHSIAPNTHQDIRYVVYFRPFSKSHQPADQYRKQAMTNIWLDWPAMKKTVDTFASLPLYSDIALAQHSHSSNFGEAIMEGVDNPYQVPRPASRQRSPSQISSLEAQANKLCDSEKWNEGWDSLRELAPVKWNDWVVQFRAAFCCCSAVDRQRAEYAQGEVFARRSICLMPFLAVGYGVLARLLFLQCKYREVFPEVHTMLSKDKPDGSFAWGLHFIELGIQTALDTLRELGSFQDHHVIITTAASDKYPELKEKFDAIVHRFEAENLWKEGDVIMKKDPKKAKDWLEGQRIFSRLAQLQPEIIWTHVQAAACFTYGPVTADVYKGESFARTVIDMDPLLVCGYALLGRNLCRQGRLSEVVAVIEPMLHCKHVSSFMNYLLLQLIHFRSMLICFQKGYELQKKH